MRPNTLRELMLLGFLAIALLTTGVGSASAQQPATPPPPSKFKLMSAAYTDGGMVPTQYSCADPSAASPALQWSNPPAAAVSLAVIFHDSDGAPAKGSMDVTHWIFWNIPATSSAIQAGVKPDASPDGMVQGKNIRGVNGFQPPCPPPGATPHHYIFEMYALDTKLDLPAGATRADLLKAIDGHVVGKATYVGMFGR
jgi:Raf kinase inhibitor-like YbhB/YbcL family protein